MRRFVRAWRIALRLTALSIRAAMEYRVQFLLEVAIGAIWQVSVLVFATVLLTRFPGMGGWSSAEVLLVASMRLFSHGLQVLVYGRITWLGGLVFAGVLEAFMLRPMPVYRQVQLSMFPANAIGDLTVATALLTGALVRVGIDWSPWRIGYLVVAIVGGTLMEAAMMTVVSSISMHAPATLYWAVWLEDLLATFGNYPLSILPRLLRDALTFLLPIAFIAYLPAAVLTGHLDSVGVPAFVAVLAPVVGLVAFVAARRLWLVSLRHYKGMGSN